MYITLDFKVRILLFLKKLIMVSKHQSSIYHYGKKFCWSLNYEGKIEQFQLLSRVLMYWRYTAENGWMITKKKVSVYCRITAMNYEMDGMKNRYFKYGFNVPSSNEKLGRTLVFKFWETMESLYDESPQWIRWQTTPLPLVGTFQQSNMSLDMVCIYRDGMQDGLLWSK